MESKKKEKKKKPIKITRGGPPARIRHRTQTKSGNEYDVWDLYWTEMGKRRCTSRSSYEEASTLAAEIAIRLARGEIRQRILSGAELAEYEEALATCQATGGTLAHAARLLKYISPADTNKTVEEVRELFLESKESREDRTKESLKSDTKFLAQTFGDRLLITLNVQELTKWVKDMPVKGRTKRNRYSSARTMFRWARKMGYLPDGMTAIERVDEATWADTAGDDVDANWEDEDDWDGNCLLTPEQLQDLFKAIPDRLIPTLAFSAFQGIRRSELLRMHWGMVKGDTITVPKIVAKKIGKRRVIPFLPATAAWVTPLKQPKGRIVPSNDRFNQLTEIAKKIGIDPWPQNVLRHSFISYRLAILKDEPEVAREAGTSVGKIRSNYDEKASEEDAIRWFSMFPPSHEQPLPPEAKKPS